MSAPFKIDMANIGSQVAKLAADLALATEEHESASRAAEVARHNETTALNRLNAAQKAMDEFHAALRAGAPYQSEWKRGAQEDPNHGNGRRDKFPARPGRI